MKHWVAIGLFLAPAAVTGAQQVVLEPSGTRVRDVIVLDLASKDKLGVTVDADASNRTRKALIQNEVFVARGSKVNVTMEYLNPLKNAWSVKNVNAEHPSYAAARQFVEAASGVLGAMSAAAQPAAGAAAVQEQLASPGANAMRMATMSPIGGPPGGRGSPPAPMPGDSARTPQVFAPELVDWALFAGTANLGRCYSDTAGANAFIRAIEEADRAFYVGDDSPESKGREAAQFSVALKAARDALIGASTMSALRTGRDAATDSATRLDTLNARAGRSLTAIKSLIGQVPWLNRADCLNFKRYTNGVVARFMTATAEILPKRQAVAKSVTDLVEGIGPLIPKGDDGTFVLARLNVPDDSVTTTTVVIRRRKPEFVGDQMNLTETAADTITIRLRRRQMHLWSFSPGLAWAKNLSYPRYGTDTSGGRTIVVSAGSDDQQYSAIGVLNGVFDFDLPGSVYPMFQLGVGTAAKYPLGLVGVGVAFPKKQFSLSVGAAIFARQVLSGLQLGQEVSGTADIEKALKWDISGRPAFYLAIQRAP